MHLKHLLAALIAGLYFAPLAQAAVSAEEAAKLKTTLTPLGAERAANKDGSIPAWDGGVTKAAAGYKSGDPRPDPFAAEKPLLSINAKNMDAHAAQLSDGVKALMKKYPDFRIDVYPTHRSAAAFNSVNISLSWKIVVERIPYFVKKLIRFIYIHAIKLVSNVTRYYLLFIK